MGETYRYHLFEERGRGGLVFLPRTIWRGVKVEPDHCRREKKKTFIGLYFSKEGEKKGTTLASWWRIKKRGL